MSTRPIETNYRGHRFRSRLEARWAVFFDALGIPWLYEPQGYRINGRPYLPDFLLTECGTWVEVKGSESDLDKDLLRAAGQQLPQMPYRWEPGPRLMVLGPIPEPIDEGDWGWRSFGANHSGADGSHGFPHGFASYFKHARPWALWNPVFTDHTAWLLPSFDDSMGNAIPEAYRAAKSARFEHGESGLL